MGEAQEISKVRLLCEDCFDGFDGDEMTFVNSAQEYIGR